MNTPTRRKHFLVIGAQRCGTTYLHELLADHPDIAMARPSRPEPKVFLSDEVVDRGPEWYDRTWFSHAGTASLLGEKSTSYLESPDAVARVTAVLGRPRILVQLRDPVERAVSNWGFSRAHGMEDRPVAEALARNLDGPLPWDPQLTSVSPYAYLERGRYADYLAPWLDAFPDLVRVQFLEDLVERPSSVGELYAWLGVDPGVRPESLGQPVNQGVGLDESLDDALVERLRDYFRDSDQALAELLGHELPWHTTVGGAR
ncbi:MAG: sulfotransferase family protein [Nocardioides sp.]